MEIGIGIPRWPDPPGLKRFAESAEELGYECILAGDHIVLPTAGTNQYPYSSDGSFLQPVDDPYLETMTTLGYLAAVTSRIKIGSTVIILPYRNPVVQAKMFASLDVLTNGRIICGVGVGWLEKEFQTLGLDYHQRGAMTDEFLGIMQALWTQPDPEYHGKYYDIDGVKFEPKPIQQSGIPIWVGGHTKAAMRRTAKYGNCWHTSRQTPDFVAENLPYLRERVEKEGRGQSEVTVSLKRSVHFTDIGLGDGGPVRAGGAVVGTTQQVIDDLHVCQEIGIDQLTYDFQVGTLSDSIKMMEHLADKVLPVAQRLG